MVDRLRARGLVATADDAHDRRRRAVALTPAGRRVTEAAISVAAQITAQTLAPLSLQEQLTAIHQRAMALCSEQYRCLNEVLMPALHSAASNSS